MNWTGHTLAVLIVCGTLVWLKIIPLEGIGWIVIPAILMSTMIDWDLKLPFVKHRGATHTILFVAFCAFVAYLITRGTGVETEIVTGIIIGGLTHLGADMI